MESFEQCTEITGDITDIIFKNEANGYTVCVMKTKEGEVTAVGNLPFVNQGDRVKVTGVWVQHKDYGDQFKVVAFEKCQPDTCETIEKSLTSGLIKGIGPVTAKKIVEKFGLDTLKIIDTQPDKLAEIKGISLKKAQEISKSYKEKAEAQRIILAFQEYGITPGYAMKIYGVYGNQALNRVKEDPYCLTEEVFGIGFKTADTIAMKMGMDMSSDSRVTAGIRYVLSQAAGAGHTYLPENLLVEKTSALLGVLSDQVEHLLAGLVVDKHVIIEQTDSGRNIYLSVFYTAEKNAALKLLRLAEVEYHYDSTSLDDRINRLEIKNNITLDDTQKEAVKQAVTNGVLVITGGPGTGKTTIINTIIGLLKEDKKEFSLAAPTGRAAKRMTQATGYEAKTLHRLLEIGYKEEGNDETALFARDEENPLAADVIIIDEMSMVDILLMNHLLKAITPGTVLIMVGDANQLPSVGPGNVLRDIISSEKIKKIKLTRIYRQNENSMITMNAHHINSGNMPEVNNRDGDFFFLTKNSTEKIVSTVVDLCTKRLPNTYGYNPMEDIQVLTPLRKGTAGVYELNLRLQGMLNPKRSDRREYKFRDFTYREGDKVMQIKNNYNLTWVMNNNDSIWGEGIFNGDMGIIEDMDDEAKTAKIIFEDRYVYYEYALFDELEPAYAITVHKSQGSEFPAVVLPIYPGPPMLMTRNLLYTAVTRAKDLVVIVGNQAVLQGMVNNVRELKRYCGLKNKLIVFSE
ncbi:MAG TPA: ATP-dependent RecD-like DNA helicase [Clostridiales bacterium]|nr:ATP-dependent RecD-like DNA helicase [Clostridiales bacterium]